MSAGFTTAPTGAIVAVPLFVARAAPVALPSFNENVRAVATDASRIGTGTVSVDWPAVKTSVPAVVV